MLNELALCSGIGGITLGLERSGLAHAVCHVEWDAYAAGVLVKNMEQGLLSPAPIWRDIHDFDGMPWRGTVDLITAGYPCQPFSVAGQRAGTDDPRHLWPEVARIIGEVGPQFVLLENVPGHLTLGFDSVLGSLDELGFDARWFTLSASEVGASHRRQRLFCWAWRKDMGNTERPRGPGRVLHEGNKLPALARWAANSSLPASTGSTHDSNAAGAGTDIIQEDAGGVSQQSGGICFPVADTAGRQSRQQEARDGRKGSGGRSEAGDVADTNSRNGQDSKRLYSGLHRPSAPSGVERSGRIRSGWPSGFWLPEPDVGRVAHGVPARVDRLRCLGNAVVPQVAEHIGRIIMEEQQR